LDHRRVAAIAPGDLIPFVRAAWELERDIHTRVETVHRMKSFGAAVTRVSNGTSREGFDAEWRSIDLMTVDGDLISRFEMFDEADLDTALARFDELSRPAQRLENAASRLVEHFLTRFAARDWDAMAESLAADYSSDDRRLVVGAGVRHGRDAAIDNYRAMADVGFANISSTVIATRGQRLAVTRAHATGVDPQPEAFRMDLLVVVEIDSDQRIAAVVVFEADDVDAAFTELDARYLTGDAAAHRET
jgi:limonene-1,2-epoxide hydrolase